MLKFLLYVLIQVTVYVIRNHELYETKCFTCLLRLSKT